MDGKRLPQGISNKNRNVHILPGMTVNGRMLNDVTIMCNYCITAAPHSIVRLDNSSYINANFVRVCTT